MRNEIRRIGLVATLLATAWLAEDSRAQPVNEAALEALNSSRRTTEIFPSSSGGWQADETNRNLCYFPPLREYVEGRLDDLRCGVDRTVCIDCTTAGRVCSDGVCVEPGSITKETTTKDIAGRNDAGHRKVIPSALWDQGGTGRFAGLGWLDVAGKIHWLAGAHR